mmetsp:Transcript_32249/g.73489  ORF Transcript_32249/g.73489 Transcript_32249/m.73489 type:complete len:640 (-) Transcript_32249:35-1954(-)
MDAIAAANKAKEAAVEKGDQKAIAASLHALAEAQEKAGKLEDCLKSADEALDIYLELKDKSGEAGELLAMSGWYLKAKDVKQALEYAEDALEIYQLLKSPEEIKAMQAIFAAQVERGNTAKAAQVASQGVKRYQETGEKGSEADALDMLMNAYCKMEKWDQALATAEKALTLYQDLDNKAMEAKVSACISSLHFQLGHFDKALQTGEDALSLVMETGEDSEKADAYLTLAESHFQKGDMKMALQVCNDMRNYFQKSGDVKSEAAALMAVAQIQVDVQEFDQAASAASRAQTIMGEQSDAKGEAFALRMTAEVQMRKKEYKSALRSAERARTLFREIGNDAQETAALYLVASNAFELACDEGAKVGEGSLPKAAKDALDKAVKASDGAVKLARDLLSDNGQEILAYALGVQAQCMMMLKKPEDALRSADEAVILFREIGSDVNEASALLISADALRHTRSYDEAAAAAREALQLFQNHGDGRGEELSNKIIGFIEEIIERRNQQWLAQQAAQNPQQWQMQMQFAPQEAQGGGGEQAASLARPERERGPALDLSAGLDVAVVKAKVMDIASRITGAEEGEIESDTPLMEAGLTSNSAILLRDELSAELPGITLPVTLVFDYPSIAAMSDLIVESSQAKIKR